MSRRLICNSTCGVLKVILQRELNFTIRAGDGSDHPGCAGAVRDRSIRLSEAGMVEEIEELSTKLHILRFGDLECFAQRGIPTVGIRTDQRVAAGIAEGKVGRNRIRIGVELEVRAALSTGQVAVRHNLVRAQQTLGPCVRRVITHLGREREAAGQRVDAAQVPSPGNQIADAAATEQAVTFAEGKQVVIAENPTEALVEVSQASVGCDVPGVLRTGGAAADFRLVVERLAPGERA